MRTSPKSVRTRIFTVVVATAAIALLALFFAEPRPSGVEAGRLVGSNLGFFLLINLNIVVVMVLVFLVVKNIVKLVLDRRRKALGSRLQVRLIGAFVGLSLVPTVLLFLVAKGILETVVQGWFSPQVAASVDGAVRVAKYHYDEAEAQVYRNVRYLARELRELSPYLYVEDFSDPVVKKETEGLLKTYLEKKREEYGLFELSLVDAAGHKLLETKSLEAERGVVDLPGPNLASLYKASRGSLIVRPEQSLNGEFLRGYVPIESAVAGGLLSGAGHDNTEEVVSEDLVREETTTQFFLMATLYVPVELSRTLAGVLDAYDDHKELKIYRRPLASTYLLTLVVVTLLIIFSAIWVGFYLARGLTVPIRQLARGTEQVAHGNLDYRIEELGDDELSVLVRSFNTMTEDLKITTDELVERRQYMEAVLASVGVGVISVGNDSKIATVNKSAASILGIAKGVDVVGKEFGEVLPESLTKKLGDMLGDLYASEENVLSDSLSLYVGADSKHVQITVTKLVDQRGEILGAVTLLDDVTELVSAQRMAAWREVARRIAHEIKNPLTPIQLAAQRMQRKLGRSSSGAGDGATMSGNAAMVMVEDSTETIIKQVEILRTLVNEFSQFARMPKAKLTLEDLNTLISDTVSLYMDTHGDIDFRTELDKSLPLFELDREQISRVLINLIDNGIASVRGAVQGEQVEGGTVGQISISSKYDSLLQLVSMGVSDTGLGIPDSDKSHVFEPYYSTKKGGTGLGLVIVQTIVADHNGYIRVRDHEPRGVTFVIELPVIRAMAKKAVSS